MSDVLTAAFDPGLWAQDLRRRRRDLASVEPGSFCVWRGSERIEPGVLSAPYCTYHKSLDELWRVLEAAGLAKTPVRWTEWAKTAPAVMKGSEGFAEAKLDDVAMYLIALRRAERFNDGVIGRAYEDGFLLTALDRLIELAPSLPYDGRRSPWAETSV